MKPVNGFSFGYRTEQNTQELPGVGHYNVDSSFVGELLRKNQRMEELRKQRREKVSQSVLRRSMQNLDNVTTEISPPVVDISPGPTAYNPSVKATRLMPSFGNSASHEKNPLYLQHGAPPELGPGVYDVQKSLATANKSLDFSKYSSRQSYYLKFDTQNPSPGTYEVRQQIAHKAPGALISSSVKKSQFDLPLHTYTPGPGQYELPNFSTNLKRQKNFQNGVAEGTAKSWQQRDQNSSSNGSTLTGGVAGHKSAAITTHLTPAPGQYDAQIGTKPFDSTKRSQFFAQFGRAKRELTSVPVDLCVPGPTYYSYSIDVKIPAPPRVHLNHTSKRSDIAPDNGVPGVGRYSVEQLQSGFKLPKKRPTQSNHESLPSLNSHKYMSQHTSINENKSINETVDVSLLKQSQKKTVLDQSQKRDAEYSNIGPGSYQSQGSLQIASSPLAVHFGKQVRKDEFLDLKSISPGYLYETRKNIANTEKGRKFTQAKRPKEIFNIQPTPGVGAYNVKNEQLANSRNDNFKGLYGHFGSTNYIDSLNTEENQIDSN